MLPDILQGTGQLSTMKNEPPQVLVVWRSGNPVLGHRTEKGILGQGEDVSVAFS